MPPCFCGPCCTDFCTKTTLNIYSCSSFLCISYLAIPSGSNTSLSNVKTILIVPKVKDLLHPVTTHGICICCFTHVDFVEDLGPLLLFSCFWFKDNNEMYVKNNYVSWYQRSMFAGVDWNSCRSCQYGITMPSNNLATFTQYRPIMPHGKHTHNIWPLSLVDMSPRWWL